MGWLAAVWAVLVAGKRSESFERTIIATHPQEATLETTALEIRFKFFLVI